MFIQTNMFVFNKQKLEDADDIFQATDNKSLTEFINECNNITDSSNINSIKFIIISNMLSIHSLINNIENHLSNLYENIEANKNVETNDKLNYIHYKNFILAVNIFKLSVFIFISSKKYDIIDNYKYRFHTNLFRKFIQLVKHFNFLYYKSWKHLHKNNIDNSFMELYTLKLIDLNDFSNYIQIFTRYLY